MILKTGIAVVVAFAVRSALLNRRVVEFKLCLEWQCTAEDSIVVAAGVNKLGVGVHAWRLRRVVPHEKRE